MKRKGLKAGHYFKEIKMNLYEKKKEIKSKNSVKILPLTLMIQRVLEKLKYLSIDQIKRYHPFIQNNNIKYVVPLPSIFDEFQKNIIMEACINAGLIKEEDDKSLFFPLESEAIEYYCLNNKSIDQKLMKECNHFMIYELGLVQHNEINGADNDKLESYKINKLIFEDIIFKIFGCKDFNTYYNRYKKAIEDNEGNEDIEEDETLLDYWYELERNVSDFIEGTNIQNIINNEYYPINFSFFKDIFKPIICFFISFISINFMKKNKTIMD